MDPNNPYPLQSTKTLYQAPWMIVREDTVKRPNGQLGIYDVIEMHDSVAIIAVDEKQQLCLVKVFRHAQNIWAWELPGGGGDDEGPIHSAMRQLADQTGFVAREYEHIGSIRPHGISTERTNIVVMSNLLQTGENNQDEEGVAEVQFQSVENVDKSISSGEIDDAVTIASLTIYKSWHQSR